MRTSSQITWNAITKWVATLANAGVGLLLIPFLISQLGKEGYGLSVIVVGIVSLNTMADLGLRGALTRQLAAEITRKDWRKFNENLSSALAMYAGVGLLAAGCCVALAPMLARAFAVPAELMPQGVFLIRVYASVAFLTTLVRTCFSAVLTSHHRFDLANYVNAGTGIMKGVTLFVVLSLTDTGLYGWAIGTLACLMLAAMATYVLARRTCPQMALTRVNVHSWAIRGLLSLGMYFFFINLIQVLGEHADPIVLTVFLGPAAVALYSPARVLSAMGRTFVMAMAWQLHPLATSYYVNGEMQKLQVVLLRGTRYSLLMGIPVCIFLVVFAEPITAIWLGEQLGESYVLTARLLAIFAVVELLTCAGGSQGAIMIGMKRLKFPLMLNLPLAVLNLVGSILLVGYTDLGVLGVAIPTLVAFSIRRVCDTVYVAWIAEVRLGRYLREAFLRPVILLVLLVPVAAGLQLWLQPRALFALLLCAGLGAVIWASLCWLIGLNRADRQSFSQLFARVGRKLFSSGGAGHEEGDVAGPPADSQSPDDDVDESI